MMNGNAELLNFIYQNSEMGVLTINKLIDISEEEEFKRHLHGQLDGYREIHSRAKDKLNENGYGEKGISAFEKIRTYLMIDMQTLTDKTASHISEMLIIGSNMGIIGAVKDLKKYKDAQQDIRKIMEDLMQFEENNIQQLKKFL